MSEELSWQALRLLSEDDVRLQAFRSAHRLTCTTPLGTQVWHRFGSVQSPPLVLLHGGSGSWLHWIKNVVPLARTHCVYAIDLPSMGDSDLPKGVQDANDLIACLQLGLKAFFSDEPVPVVGFSFGGLCAGLLGAQYPQLIESLVLVGAPGMGLFGPTLKLRGLTAGMDEREVLAVMKHNLRVMMVMDEAVLDEFTLHLQLKNVSRDRLRKRRMARSDVMLSLQHAWRFPVHTIWGEFDALYQGRLAGVRELLSGCDLKTHTLIEGAGHWVMYEKADAFNALLAKLLSGAQGLVQ